MARKRTDPKEKHVRIHLWEMNTEAWKSMSTDARALLIEFRALWNEENRIFLSVRQIMQRMNVSQRRAQRARDELLERGWIRVMERGGFSRKVRHATVFALTNEPIHAGQLAPKDYMRFSTVADSTTDSSQFDYRGGKVTPEKTQVGSQSDYRAPAFSPSLGSRSDYTVSLPTRGKGKARSVDAENEHLDGLKTRAAASADVMARELEAGA